MSSNVLLYTVMSSMKTLVLVTSCRRKFMVRWNVAGALQSPNGITKNCKLLYLIWKAVFLMEYWCRRI